METLHKAVVLNSLEDIKSLLPNNTIINLQNKFGETALFLAVVNNNIDIVEILLIHGARMDIPNNEGNTVLHIAIQNNYIDIINQLIKYPIFVDVLCYINHSSCLPLYLTNNEEILKIINDNLSTNQKDKILKVYDFFNTKIETHIPTFNLRRFIVSKRIIVNNFNFRDNKIIQANLELDFEINNPIFVKVLIFNQNYKSYTDCILDNLYITTNKEFNIDNLVFDYYGGGEKFRVQFVAFIGSEIYARSNFYDVQIKANLNNLSRYIWGNNPKYVPWSYLVYKLSSFINHLKLKPYTIQELDNISNILNTETGFVCFDKFNAFIKSNYNYITQITN